MTNGIEVTKVEKMKVRKTPAKKSTAKARASAKKTAEIKEEVKDVANDVSEKMKAELEQVIAANIEQATVDSKLNKALRNAAIACVVVVGTILVWNFVV